MQWRKLKKYNSPTRSWRKDSVYDKSAADDMLLRLLKPSRIQRVPGAVSPLELIDWQEQIVRDVFGILKQTVIEFNMADGRKFPRNKGRSCLLIH